MAVAKALPLFSLVLSALCSSTLAGSSGHFGKRAPLSNRGIGTCHIEGWVPACSGAFACIPPGGVCCSDGTTYALGSETCPEGTNTLPGPGSGAGSSAGSGSSTGFGSGSGDNPDSDPARGPGGPEGQSQDASAPSPTTPPHSHPDPLGPDVGPDFIDFGSNWYTFSMTFHFLSHWYSLVDHTSSVLVSSEILSCSTVSVSATDAAQASAIFSSISATAALSTPSETEALLPVPNETQAAPAFPIETHIPAVPAPPIESHAPAALPPPVDAVGSSAPLIPAVSESLAPVATGGWKRPVNGTVGTAKQPPTGLVTAGAARLRGLGGLVVGVVGFVLGRVVLL